MGRQIGFAVADPDTDALLGSLGVMDISDGSAEIGYWSHRDARGRGAMSEAVRLVVDLARRSDGDGLGLRRLLLRAAEGNSASRRVATAAGFQQVGVDHSASRRGDGAWSDDVRYELLTGLQS
jgi:RimJ/RimL family protein N-acetyltransferase